MEKIIIKIGTAVLSGENAENSVSSLQSKIDQILASVIPNLDPSTQQLLIVSSGAVGIGRHVLGISDSNGLLSTKQVCASLGQVRLIECYQKTLSKYSYQASQILLTSDIFSDSEKKNNLMNCLSQMAGQKIVAIVNENDVISTEELEPNPKDPNQGFSDNDRLSSLLATELDASLLILLMDGSGIYKSRPTSSDTPPIGLVKDSKDLDDIEIWKSTTQGRGGIESKISSLKFCMNNGVSSWVTSGTDYNGLKNLFENWGSKTPPESGTFVVGKGSQW